MSELTYYLFWCVVIGLAMWLWVRVVRDTDGGLQDDNDSRRKTKDD